MNTAAIIPRTTAKVITTEPAVVAEELRATPATPESDPKIPQTAAPLHRGISPSSGSWRKGRRNEQSPSQEQRRDEKRVANDASPVDNGIAQKPLKADEQIDPSAKRGKSQKQTSPGAVKIHREEGSNFRSVVPFASRPHLHPRALTFLHKTLPQHSFVKAFTYYTSDLVALPKNNEAITCRNSDFTFSW